MKQNYATGTLVPTAGICINRSRLKVYHKESTPTYYLEDAQEFSVELYNPTQETVLAKIQLNGKEISQGGLVLKPAERIFLERYLDVAKKFKFETYTVSNTTESKKAIELNGDIVIKFYRESPPTSINYSNYSKYGQPIITYTSNIPLGGGGGYPRGGYPIGDGCSTQLTSGTVGMAKNSLSSNSTPTTSVSSYLADAFLNNTSTCYSSSVTMDSFEQSNNSLRGTNIAKTIETGRVEAGTDSNQKFEYVNKEFLTWPFHTVEYKLLPVSNKVNTTEDINVKRYCHNCGAKQKSEHKFCPVCGQKH